MGNCVAFDSQPPGLEELISGLQNDSRHLRTEIISNGCNHAVYLWRVFSEHFQQSNLSQIKNSSVRIKEISEFREVECYIVLHIRAFEEAQLIDICKENQEDIHLDLEQLCSSTSLHLTPRGLKTPFQRKYSTLLISHGVCCENHNGCSSNVELVCEIYLWKGTSSAPLVKATALSLALKLEKVLEMDPSLLGLLYMDNGNKILCNISTLWKNEFSQKCQPLSIVLEEGKKSSTIQFVTSKLHRSGKVVLPSLKIPNGTPNSNPSTAPKEPSLDDLASWSAGELIRHFDPLCSQINEFIFLGSRVPASDKETLKRLQITHILNCAGTICENLWPDEFVYKTLYLMDGPGQEIESLFFPIIDFFEEARTQNGKVLVHCHQGVSRSSSMVICYLMWKMDINFETAHEFVKLKRFVASPNPGFIAQLIQWRRRLMGDIQTPRLLRIAPHSLIDRLFLVAKAVEKMEVTSLDCRTCFLVVDRGTVYLWKGDQCPSKTSEAALIAISLLKKYEGAAEVFLVESNETARITFWSFFGIIDLNANLNGMTQIEYDAECGTV